jgi:hypothetical protein
MSSWFANWWFSESKEKIRLIRINEIYLAMVGPISNILKINDDVYPMHRFTELEQNAQADENRIGKENYFVLPDRIVETIEDYIVTRNQRLFGSGHPGDALSLVLLELRDWALNHLTKYDYDEDSIQLLIKRKNYLLEIIRQSIFKKAYFGKRAISKDDTFESIVLLIDDCIIACREEQKKQTVRDHLRKCRNLSVGILKNSLSTLYLLSDHHANKKAIHPNKYLNCSDNVAVDCNLESKIYKRILSTENGLILKDLILLSGLDASGFPKPKDPHAVSHYYDANHKSNRKLKWGSKIVPYDWSKQNSVVSIEKYQDLGEHLLQLSKILADIEIRYKHIGENGNETFSKSGVIRFKAAIAQLKSLQENLISQLSEHIESLESERRKYFYENHINNNDHIWNQNFNHISKRIAIIKKLSKLINIEISKMEVLINSLSSHVENEPDVEILSIERAAARALRFPISVTNKGFVVLNKSQFRHLKDDSNLFSQNYSNGWKLGDNYKLWSQGFLTLHKDFFDKYNSVLDQTVNVSQNKDIPALKLQSDILKSIFIELLTTINFEKPQWRFKHSIIPVSLGWPFHSAARSFAEALSRELKNRFILSDKFISSRIDSLIAYQHSHISIESQLSNSAKKLQKGDEFAEEIRQVAQSTLSTEVEEFKEDAIVLQVQKHRTIDKLCKDANAVYIAWARKYYSTTVTFFRNKLDAETLMNDMLNHFSEASEQLQGCYLFSATSLHRELTRCLTYKVLNTPEQKQNFMQVTLLAKFLLVIKDFKSENYLIRKNEFESYCEMVFAGSNVQNISGAHYNNFGLLGANSSSDVMPEAQPSLALQAG